MKTPKFATAKVCAVKDFFDHREEASRFIGIASALLADDTDIQHKCVINE